MGQRTLTKIYDATSAAGGSIDSGVAGINTECYSALVVAVVAAGAAAPASAYALAVLDSVPTLAIITTTVGSGVAIPVANSGTVTVFPQPTAKTRFQATGGAASTVRLVVYGVRD